MGNESISIKSIIGRHENQPGFVMGLGPSLSPYISEIEKMKQHDFILLSTNYWYRIFDNRVDYWILANNVCRIEKHYKVMNDFNKSVFYADTVDMTNKEFIKKNLTCEYLGYDERNFGNPNRLTINEELQRLSGNDEMYGSAGTVSLHMLAFAILMKCNPIYIAGVDLNYNNRDDCYARGKKPPYVNKQIDRDAFIKNFDAIIDSFKILYDSAKKMGIRLINLNNNSKLDFIEKSEIIYGS